MKIDGKLVLTKPGNILYEQAVKILTSVDEAKRYVRGFDSDKGGEVKIGILPTLAPFILPNALSALSEKFADAVILIREEISESLIAAAQQGELDILIESLPFNEKYLDIEPLFSDPFYLAVHKNHPLASSKEIHVNSLEGMSFILLEDMHCMTRQIERFCFNEQFVPKVVFQASQISTIKLLIESNYGVSILPSIAIQKNTDSQIRYVTLVSENQPPKREIVLATVKDRYFSPVAKYFIDTIKKQYQQIKLA